MGLANGAGALGLDGACSDLCFSIDPLDIPSFPFDDKPDAVDFLGPER